MDIQIKKWTGLRTPNSADGMKMFEKKRLSYCSFANLTGDTYASHRHEYNKFLIMVHGSMRWIIDGKEHELTAGDSVTLPANAIHEVTVAEDSECWEGHFSMKGIIFLFMG